MASLVSILLDITIYFNLVFYFLLRKSVTVVRFRYCMRWGLLSPTRLRECAWKKLYIQVNLELNFKSCQYLTFMSYINEQLML